MGGGLTDWHRQKRKKEQKKNKEKRLAERDARVLETKTVRSVQEEIKQVERHHKVKTDEQGNAVPLPHAVQSKLDRLRKELKILQQQAESQDNKGSNKTAATANKKQEWKPLDNPQLSVYYDAVLNPFGEPPPGQPRLYHTADGRTTFHLHEAAMPGSRPPPRKEPPQEKQQRHRPPPQQQSSSRPRDKGPPKQQQQQQGRRGTREDESAKSSKAAPPPPPPAARQSSTAASTTINHSTQQQQQQQQPSSTKQAPPTTREAPSLPAPSQAVKRGRSRLKADIWASTEEIDYHEHADDPDAQVKLEGVDTAKDSDHQLIKEWWYEDRQHQQQGPFPHEQMVAWIKAGYFPKETRGKPRLSAPWKPFHHYPIMRAVLSGKDEDQQQQPKELSLQDRIASLRRQHKKTSIADRIAALKGGPKPTQETAEAVPDNDDNAEDNTKDPLPPVATEEEANEPMPVAVRDAIGPVTQEDALPPPPAATFEEEQVPAYPVEDALPPPPPPAAAARVVMEQAPYAIDEMQDNVLPPPPPPAIGEDRNEIPAYVVDEVPAYGADDYPPPYPTADYAGDVAYPVDENGADDEDDVPVTDDYPVVGSYPVAAEEDSSPVDSPPAKKVKVDRAVISFLPTNIRKRK